jgi:ATP-dependent Lon protease
MTLVYKVAKAGEKSMDRENSDLNEKINHYFPGRVVRKDLTQKIKEGANVPVYVLEYLLGMYCATDDEDSISDGVNRVKAILSENYVRADEAEKIKSKIRELGQYTVIDKLTVRLNEKRDVYEAEFSNLGLKGVEVEASYVKEFEKLLAGGIWCILKIDYYYDEDARNANPFIINSLKPIQIPNLDMDEILSGRKYFTKDEWIDVLLRSVGMEPTQLEEKVKWHLIARMIPLVENNFNLCELGPRGTGKSHIYKEISPNSILISGGQTTVANLFYNMNTRKIGLVGLWDVVAFDEVAGVTFKDKDGIQIMKDYMASGSFARGKELKNAFASMVFVKPNYFSHPLGNHNPGVIKYDFPWDATDVRQCTVQTGKKCGHICPYHKLYIANTAPTECENKGVKLIGGSVHHDGAKMAPVRLCLLTG